MVSVTLPSILTDDTQLGSDVPNAPVAASIPRLLPGSVLGNYQVVGHLGAGAMGTVYRARDQRLGRDVALKFRPASAEGQTSCKLLCSLLGREAQTLASLSHPNLLAIYDVGEHRGCIFLALELVDGVTVRQWAAPGRSAAERRRVIIDAGRGLVAAHAAGVVHRDIKPDNVLVANDGRVKVADFGLARSRAHVLAWGVACGGCGSDEANAELATAVDDSVAGTPRYMAPAQLSGEPADFASDQFSYAVMAWELMFGGFPFIASTVGELRAAVAAGPVDPPSADLQLVATLRRGLAPAPEDRFATLAALVDALA
jgi:eukaryotic-like serine/threonine-protein kinase